MCAFVIVLGRYGRLPLLLARSSKHMQALCSGEPATLSSLSLVLRPGLVRQCQIVRRLSMVWITSTNSIFELCQNSIPASFNHWTPDSPNPMAYPHNHASFWVLSADFSIFCAHSSSASSSSSSPFEASAALALASSALASLGFELTSVVVYCQHWSPLPVGQSGMTWLTSEGPQWYPRVEISWWFWCF